MISILEQLMSFDQVCERVPGRKGKPVNYETVRIWADVGIRGVRLESTFMGGLRVTSAEALDRFHLAVNAIRRPQDPEPENEDAHTPRGRKRRLNAQARKSQEILERLGFGV